jgi:hypothetical protein
MARTRSRRHGWEERRGAGWDDPERYSSSYVREFDRRRREQEARRDALRQLAAAGVARARV